MRKLTPEMYPPIQQKSSRFNFLPSFHADDKGPDQNCFFLFCRFCSEQAGQKSHCCSTRCNVTTEGIFKLFSDTMDRIPDGIDRAGDAYACKNKNIYPILDCDNLHLPKIDCENLHLRKIDCDTLHLPKMDCENLHLRKIDCENLHLPKMDCENLHFPKLECENLHLPKIDCENLHFPQIDCDTLHFPEIDCATSPDI